MFHRFNTKDEKKREEETARKSAGGKDQDKLTPVERAAADRIEAFLEKQKKTAK